MDPLIRNRQEAVEAVEAYSPAEQQFNQRRKTTGMVLAPILFAVMLALPLSSLTPRRTASRRSWSWSSRCG